MASPPAPSLIAALEASVHRVLEQLAVELADLGLTHGEVNALAQLEPRGGVHRRRASGGDGSGPRP